MGTIRRIYGHICRIEEIIAGLFLVTILVLIFGAAVARGLRHPLAWAMDMATFLFAWAVFFSADAAMRNDRHVNVDLFVSRLPKKVQFYIAVLNHLIIVAFLGFLIAYGVRMSYLTRFRAFQGIPGFSYMWVTLSVPVGSFLLLISTVLKIGRIVGDHRRQSAAESADAKTQALQA
ncbi:MAG: TRAP transporter small permease [Firmicutes bacterium]|jgi:TRAP-type C4-dicarboxylate transport system permease small subunit|nr:TRAP transporter small permease [Bacillota bacterium]